MWTELWKTSLLVAAMAGLMVLPACEDETELETTPPPVSTDPVRPMDTGADRDVDLDIRTTPQDRPGVNIDTDTNITTQPGQQQPGQNGNLQPLPQPGQEEKQPQQPQPQGDVQPLPQPQPEN